MPSFVNKARKLIDTKICYIPNVVKPVPDNETADLAADKKIGSMQNVVGCPNVVNS